MSAISSWDWNFVMEKNKKKTSTTDLAVLVQLLNTKCAEPFHDCLTKLLSDAEEKPVACLISDAIFSFTQAVAENEFLEIAWGLANSKQPFLWVVRPGLTNGSEWLEPLPSGFLEMIDGRGHIVKWAPQQEVLAHPAVGAFWTHNGWNSTLESTCEGVPMICMPCFTDQRVNARYATGEWP
ncbi:hypothetical protein Patl1_06491 [Pistacia atlantica]|uniref:Uncharacterized protein n=1 Tax=Pistacia atlantica TaxID=434234 RepID=A0ACC1BV45_9ROSI|nr:hypothetical protein Patl1_06491 [Pistacia atlantica]